MLVGMAIGMVTGPVAALGAMMNLMTPLTSRVGPDMNRPTADNVRKAGFTLKRVNNVFLDVVKTIHAVK
jgi:phosphatidylethanolamine/phosphatidyl-N-methylethanolamine N-methyltransferase